MNASNEPLPFQGRSAVNISGPQQTRPPNLAWTTTKPGAGAVRPVRDDVRVPLPRGPVTKKLEIHDCDAVVGRERNKFERCFSMMD
jgi:hypothetical protein